MGRAAFVAVVTLLLLGILASGAAALVNLEWRPSQQVVSPGDTVRIGLYAVSDSALEQPISALDVIVNWDPTYLSNLSLGDPQDWWLTDGFFTDASDGININTQDGTVMYTAWANFGGPVVVGPQGLLCVEFLFRAAAPTNQTNVGIAATYGLHSATSVFHGTIPNYDIKGTLGSASVSIVPEPASVTIVVLGIAGLVLRRRR